jgi:hypothetical protein
MTISDLSTGIATGIRALVPPAPARYHDPAEYLDFARPLAANFLPYDSRSQSRLEAAAFDSETALERERALWELADRAGASVLPVVRRFLGAEPERTPRQTALWLALKTAGPEALPLLEEFRGDADPEVADWARVLHADISGSAPERVYTTAHVEETGHFDQTVPLLISGHVVVTGLDVGPMRAVLSPLWFDSILGRVLASTNVKTFATDLTIEKELKGLHADGTPHYEIFPFRGISVEYEGNLVEHNYLSETIRAFYPSGIVEKGAAAGVPVSLARVAATALARQGEVEIQGDGERADRLRAAPMPFVQSVRGRFFGWAAANLEAILEAGIVGAGHVQLSNPTDPVAGPMTNAKLYGTFRGKSGDYTGAGRMTLNAIKCHGTPDGHVDLHADGTGMPDPFQG